MKKLSQLFFLVMATSFSCNCFACDFQDFIAVNLLKPELKTWICKEGHYVNGTNTLPKCGDK